jgi:hypothetical protein
MKFFSLTFFLLIVIVSQAQHSFFRAQNKYVAPIEATGRVSNGLGFDGIDDGVVLNSSLLSANTNELTYELWLKPYQLGGFSALLNHENWSTGYVHFQFHGNNIGFDVNGGNDNVFSYAFNTNTWYHVALVYSSTAHTLKFYVNGLLLDTVTNNSFPIIAGNVPINMGSWANGRYFNGVMDEVRIWNVARTQSEIQSNMNSELAGTETGLVAYYPFNQGIATGDNTAINTVTDKTANALNGALTNFAKTGINSNFVVGKVNTNNNGLSAASAGKNAKEIKQNYPAAVDGIYWITNPNINSGTPFQIYADMTTDGGGWMLLNSSGGNVASSEITTISSLGTRGYLPRSTVIQLATLSTTVQLRSGLSNNSYTYIATSSDNRPIMALRSTDTNNNGLASWHNSVYTSFVASMGSCDWNDGDGVANGWPNMFHSSGNANGVHWLPTYDDAGGVNWASGYYFSTWIK